MKTTPCEKIILGESLGVKLVFCKDCNVVELEIGAVSVRLCPEVIQQVTKNAAYTSANDSLVFLQ